MIMLLDTYGELLTEKQRDFLRKYYEQDLSFGEIARDLGVSRQAIFDSVKHGEASLDHYERVLGLVRAAKAGNGAAPSASPRAAAPDSIRERIRSGAARLQELNGHIALSSVDGDVSWITREIDAVLADLAGAADALAAAPARPEASAPDLSERAAKPAPRPAAKSPEPKPRPAPRPGAFLRGGGPEVD